MSSLSAELQLKIAKEIRKPVKKLAEERRKAMRKTRTQLAKVLGLPISHFKVDIVLDYLIKEHGLCKPPVIEPPQTLVDTFKYMGWRWDDEFDPDKVSKFLYNKAFAMEKRKK